MSKRSNILTALNYLMLAVFLFCVAVQYNDPDPVRWMAIYGLAAIACVLYLTRRLHRAIPAAIGAASLIWACLLAPGVIGQVSVAEVFESMQMKTVAVEEAREMGGLFIVAVWMAVLTLTSSQERSLR